MVLIDKQRKRIGDRYILKLCDYIRLSVRMANIYFSIRINLWSGTGERAEAWECHVWAVKVERGSWRDTTHGQRSNMSWPCRNCGKFRIFGMAKFIFNSSCWGLTEPFFLGTPIICIANNCHLIGMVVSIERLQNLDMEKRLFHPNNRRNWWWFFEISHPKRQERLDSRKKRMATNRTDEDTSEKARVEVGWNSQRGCFWFYWGLCHYPLLY